MAFVALNRYVGVFHNLKMKHIFSWKMSSLMVFGIWFISFGIMMLPFTKSWGQLGFEELTFSCTIKDYKDANPLTTFLSLGCGIPLVVITYW